MIRMRGYPQHAAQEGGEAGVWFPHPAALGNIYCLRPSQAQVWDGMLPQARARAGGPARAVVVPPARRACQGPGEGDVPVTALGGTTTARAGPPARARACGNIPSHTWAWEGRKK